MWSSLLNRFFLLSCLCGLLALPAENLYASVNGGPFWKPGRLHSSGPLEWREIDSLVVPFEAGEYLSLALDDFFQTVEDRGLGMHLKDSSDLRSTQSLILELRPSYLFLEDGFILMRERSNLKVLASGEKGLANALYTLAQEYFGARWYWAGPLGYQLVGDALEQVPDGAECYIPDFVQRTLYPVKSAYGRRNRLAGKYSFNHNLARVFNKEVFRTTPEAFAQIAGRRQEPRGHGGTDPQPNLISDEAVRIAAEAVRAHFDANPASTSFSLSTNDNVLFDESPETEAAVSPLTHFRRMPNYTDLVFGFMNKVAEEVFADPKYLRNEKGEDRYITQLAYYWTEQSPSFPLHPRVMPVLTSDRAQWHDPDYRAEDKALIERWVHSGAERIATWDYYFGSPYLYPRQFNQWIAESIPYLNQSGVDVFFSQLPSVWGLDGAKTWLTTQLLWDTSLDAEALLDEYYSNFFGPAGLKIRAFYELAEAYRNANEGAARWIKFYKDEAGIELFDETTLTIMRGLLEEAAALVRGDELLSSRVKVVSDAFTITERYSEYQAARRELFELSIEVLNGGDVALERFKHVWERWQSHKSIAADLESQVNADPMLQSLKHFFDFLLSEPDRLAIAALSRIEGAAEVDLNADDKLILEQMHAWRADKIEAKPLLKNPNLEFSGIGKKNFLGPRYPKLPEWSMRFRYAEDMQVSFAEGRTNSGIRISNTDVVALDRSAAVEAEQVYVLELEAAWLVRPNSRAWLQLTWEDAVGERISSEVVLRVQSAPEEKRARMEFALRSPAGASELKIKIVHSNLCVDDYLEIRRVQLHQLMSGSPAD